MSQPRLTGDSVRSYLRDIGRIPLLEHDEEILLGRQVQRMMEIKGIELELELKEKEDLAKALGITDFSPASQERVGKHLAQQRGMNTDTVFTDKNSFLKELDKIAPEWASMPTLSTGTSYYGQGGLTPDRAWQIYNGN